MKFSNNNPKVCRWEKQPELCTKTMGLELTLSTRSKRLDFYKFLKIFPLFTVIVKDCK